MVYQWGHDKRYNDYPSYIKKKFGGRVQKISVNVGFSCPNRDGSKGVGGCIYCDNKTFKPGYCEPDIPVTAQIDQGVNFFEQKYPDMRYMAYFQSYTNTYAPVDNLRKLYTEAISHPKIVALVIGTRPDCINREILEMLADINKEYPVTIEYGIESTFDTTLTEINRCHTWKESVEAIELTASYGITVGAHLILGLPGETYEMMLTSASRISTLPVNNLKLHQLQVTKNTHLAKKYNDNPNYVKLFSFEEYISFVVDFIELLNPEIIIERFVSTSPLDKLIAPKWNRMKNFEIVSTIVKELEKRDAWQGKSFR